VCVILHRVIAFAAGDPANMTYLVAGFTPPTWLVEFELEALVSDPAWPPHPICDSGTSRHSANRPASSMPRTASGPPRTPAANDACNGRRDDEPVAASTTTSRARSCSADATGAR
jgi:hypothetical protein